MMAKMAQRFIQGFMNLNAKGIKRGPASGGWHSTLLDEVRPNGAGFEDWHRSPRIALDDLLVDLAGIAPNAMPFIDGFNFLNVDHLGSGLIDFNKLTIGSEFDDFAVEGQSVSHGLESGGGSLPPIYISKHFKKIKAIIDIQLVTCLSFARFHHRIGPARLVSAVLGDLQQFLEGACLANLFALALCSSFFLGCGTAGVHLY